MKQLNKNYLHIFLLFCLAISLVSIFPSTALSHQSIVSSQSSYLDGYIVDNIRPAIPQSEGAYIANAHTGKFHYAGCRYVAKMNDSNKVYFDSRDDAAGAGYVACKVCRP